MREPENVLERAMVLGSGPQLLLRHLAMEPATAVTATPGGLGLRDAVRQFELQHVRGVLSRAFRCGSLSTSPVSRHAPHGTPAPARICMTWCLERLDVHASISASTSSLRCQRASPVS